MTRRQIGRVLLALVIVASAVVGTSGTAAAETTISTEGCDVADYAIAPLGYSNAVDPEDDCGLYNNEDEIQDETDAYSVALASNDSTHRYLTNRNNFEEDARGVIWMEAKISAANVIANNGTEAEAQQAFNATVNNFTSRMIRNDLYHYSAQSGLAASTAAQTGATNTTNGAHIDATRQTGWIQYALPDRSTVTIQTVVIASAGDRTLVAPDFYTEVSDTNVSGEVVQINRESTSGGAASYDWVRAAPSDGPTPRIYTKDVSLQRNNGTSGVVAFVAPKTQRQQIQDWVDIGADIRRQGATYVSETHAAYQAGEIDESDLYGPITLAQEANTAYNETGANSFVNAELAALGITGATNTSHVVTTTITETEYSNGSRVSTTHDVTIEGTLFLTGDVDMSLETGQTYDPANIKGEVLMTVANISSNRTSPPPTGTEVALQNEFTIQSATNVETGEAVDVTTAKQDDYETANASRLNEQLEDLRQQRQEIEEQRASLLDTGGIGGTGGQQPQESNWWDEIFQTGLRGVSWGLGALIIVGLVALGILTG